MRIARNRRLAPCRSRLLDLQFASRIFWSALACALLTGCEPPEPTSPEQPAESTPKVTKTLRLMVVDDPRLGAMANREWSARSDTPLEITNMTSEELTSAIEKSELPTKADALIFPSRFLGGLAEARMITKVPKRTLDSESLAFSDIFNLPRRREATWGETTYAIPLGSPTFVLAYRGDLTTTEPPGDWNALDAWLESFRDKADEGTVWLAQPTNGENAANVLLARTAARIRMPGQISTLFDFRTMQPLIAQPPFVKSLDELVASAKAAPDEARDWDTAQVQRAFESGNCVAAILWMVPPDPEAEPTEIGEGVQIRFAPLPGSAEVYSYSEKAWTERRDKAAVSVPLVGMEGRLASVVKTSRRQKSAWNLLTQLAGTEMGSSVSAASQATAPVRHLQVDQSARWTGSQIEAAAAREYGATLKAALSGSYELSVLNLPAQDKYTAALSTAVSKAMNGELTAQDALDEAASEWRKINESLGTDEQLMAFARSLGIEP